MAIPVVPGVPCPLRRTTLPDIYGPRKNFLFESEKKNRCAEKGPPNGDIHHSRFPNMGEKGGGSRQHEAGSRQSATDTATERKRGSAKRASEAARSETLVAGCSKRVLRGSTKREAAYTSKNIPYSWLPDVGGYGGMKWDLDDAPQQGQPKLLPFLWVLGGSFSADTGYNGLWYSSCFRVHW